MSLWSKRHSCRRGWGAGVCACFLATCLLLSGCAGASEASPRITLTEADNAKSFEVRQGALVVVRLKENPTTGYQWAVEGGEGNVLALQSSDYMQEPLAGVGGGGQRTFMFKAIGTGTTRLRLKLWRDWQGDASIIAHFEVTLQVGI
jgi:inhibitor of cysteine peptidase